MLKKKSVAPFFSRFTTNNGTPCTEENNDFIKTWKLGNIYQSQKFTRQIGDDSRFRCEFRRDLVGPNKDLKLSTNNGTPCTAELRFARFLSGGFITGIVVNNRKGNWQNAPLCTGGNLQTSPFVGFQYDTKVQRIQRT